jgi:hypothetical protein
MATVNGNYRVYPSVSSRSGNTTLHQYQVGYRVEVTRRGDKMERDGTKGLSIKLDTGTLVVLLDSGAFEQIGPGSFEFVRRREEAVLVSRTKSGKYIQGTCEKAQQQHHCT